MIKSYILAILLVIVAIIILAAMNYWLYPGITPEELGDETLKDFVALVAIDYFAHRIKEGDI